MRNIIIAFSLIVLTGCSLNLNQVKMMKDLPQLQSSGSVKNAGEFLIADPLFFDNMHQVVERIQELNGELSGEKAGEYAYLFLKYSSDYDLDVNMVLHIAFIESRFEETAVSRAGDYGLMQINWSAHKRNLLEMGVDKKRLLDPEVNISYGCQLLSLFSKKAGSLYGVIRRYAPARPRYYTNKLQSLMNQAKI